MTIQSKKEWLQDRFTVLCNAITEKYNALETIPLEWIQEYNELIEQLES